MNKTIRIDSETYEIIESYAREAGVGIGGAANILVKRGIGAGGVGASRAGSADRDLGELRDWLKRLVDMFYGEGFSDGLSDDEELLVSLYNLEEIIEDRDERIRKLKEQIKAYQEQIRAYQGQIKAYRERISALEREKRYIQEQRMRESQESARLIQGLSERVFELETQRDHVK